MKLWKKILITCFAIALVIIISFISWSYGFRQGIRVGGLTSSMSELTLINQHVIDQMTNASCEGAKQSINDYLQIIEKYKNNKDNIITETSYYGDKMLGHIRLARIEKYSGNRTEAQKHIVIAKEACTQLRWEDCSEEKLVSFEKRMEEKYPIGCLLDKK